jgi:outer membrane murein-binding lipoprotein Lpp
MKHIFKIFLALVVILASYLAGQYAGKIECEAKINALNEKIKLVESEKITLENKVNSLEQNLINSKNNESKESENKSK